MHPTRLVSRLLIVCLLQPSVFFARQSASTPLTIQPQAALAQSFAALTGSVSITDLTLNGTVHRIVGPSDEEGTITFQALSAGYWRLQVVTPSGTRTEIRSAPDPSPAASWSGPDGVVHPAASHNVVSNVSMSPLFSLGSILLSENASVQFVGQETRNDQSVLHIAALQQYPDFDVSTASTFQQLSRVEIYLDSKSLLPVSLAFNIHPDDNMLVNVPVEFEFSDYRALNGGMSPYHIQKFLNNSLLLDIQLQQIAINSGLSQASVVAR